MPSIRVSQAIKPTDTKTQYLGTANSKVNEQSFH